MIDGLMNPINRRNLRFMLVLLLKGRVAYDLRIFFLYSYFSIFLFFAFLEIKMKVNIYTIYDKMAEECGPIFQAKNDKVACRACDSMICEACGTSVSDFQLWCLGAFDNEKREFTPIDNHDGTCGLFEEIQVGSKRYECFKDCANAQTATFILRGGAQQFLEEAERSIHGMNRMKSVMCRFPDGDQKVCEQ